MKNVRIVALTALLLCSSAQATPMTVSTFNVDGVATVAVDEGNLFGGAATVPYSFRAIYSNETNRRTFPVTEIDTTFGGITLRWRSSDLFPETPGRISLRDGANSTFGNGKTDSLSVIHKIEPGTSPKFVTGPLAGTGVVELPGRSGGFLSLSDSTGANVTTPAVLSQPLPSTWDSGTAEYDLILAGAVVLQLDVVLDVTTITSSVVPEPAGALLVASAAATTLRRLRHRRP